MNVCLKSTLKIINMSFKALIGIFIIIPLLAGCGKNDKETKSFFSETQNKNDGSGSAVFFIDKDRYAYAYETVENNNKGIMFSKPVTTENSIMLVPGVINNIEGYEAVSTKTPMNELIEPYGKTEWKIKGIKKDYYYTLMFEGEKVSGFVYGLKP